VAARGRARPTRLTARAELGTRSEGSRQGLGRQGLGRQGLGRQGRHPPVAPLLIPVQAVGVTGGIRAEALRVMRDCHDDAGLARRGRVAVGTRHRPGRRPGARKALLPGSAPAAHAGLPPGIWWHRHLVAPASGGTGIWWHRHLVAPASGGTGIWWQSRDLNANGVVLQHYWQPGRRFATSSGWATTK
jgi:hypothetical protein